MQRLTIFFLMPQNIVKALAAAKYKTQVQTLSHFYDDYGLKTDEEDGEEEEEEEQWEAWEEKEEEAAAEEVWLPGDSRADGAVEAAARKKTSRTSVIRSRPLRLADLIDMAASDPNDLKRRLATVMTAMKGEDEQSVTTSQAGERDSCSRIARLILNEARCILTVLLGSLRVSSSATPRLSVVSLLATPSASRALLKLAESSPPTPGHDD